MPCDSVVLCLYTPKYMIKWSILRQVELILLPFWNNSRSYKERVQIDISRKVGTETKLPPFPLPKLGPLHNFYKKYVYVKPFFACINKFLFSPGEIGFWLDPPPKFGPGPILYRFFNLYYSLRYVGQSR